MKRGRKAKCPYCGGHRNIAKGVRQTVTLGVRRLRVCKDCDRKFTVGRAAVVRAERVVAAPVAIVPSQTPLLSGIPVQTQST